MKRGSRILEFQGELLVGCWDTDLVIVAARVPARYALLFGDGLQGFPGAALLGAGASEEEVERLHDGTLVSAPVDAAFGRQRSRVAGLPPDHPVEVTWRARIAELIGAPPGPVQGVRHHGPDEPLRVLSRRG